MKRILIVVACCLLASAAMFAQPAKQTESFRLIAVKVKGLHEFKTEEVIEASGLKVGSMIMPGQMQTAADKLVSTGAFNEVSFSYRGERGGYVIDFEVQEAEKYLPVEFGNFVWTTDDELTQYLAQRVPLFHGRATESPQMTQNIMDALTLWLGDHKINGTAAYRLVGNLGKQSVEALSFYVDGVPMPVRSVQFENAPNLTQQEREHLAKLLLGNDYERSVAASSVNMSMEPIYQRKGYLRAKSSTPIVKIISSSPDLVEIGLTYAIDEGKQYKISSLHWSGNTNLQTADLQKTLKLGPGAVANMVELQDNLGAAKKLYGSIGMLSARIEPKPTFDDAAATVGLELAITQGTVFKMGSIEITGLNPKEVEELRGRWKLKFGEPYNSEYLQQFLRENVSIIQGRRAKTVQTIAPGEIVHLKLRFD